MNGFLEWLAQLRWDSVIEVALTAAAAVLCITFHETCHGLAALAMGDPTAKRRGRLSLNPLRHIDPMGLLMLVVARFGWAKPVPINPGYFKHPKAGMAVTALAGPGGNVLLALIAGVLYGVCAFYEILTEAAWLGWAALFFQLVVLLSIGLAVFNLLPIPPLDGSKVLFAVLPEGLYWKLMRYERYGMIVLMVLLLTGLLDGPLDFLREGALALVEPVIQLTVETLFALHF